uniref:RAP domain-containing protein n=1 Tax=Neospora caninum (strain Liverpool) TaxID=572307 RepID=A0A0F7UJV9_NEOCL|nr:TPA: hypothetical protein BN1204_060670 [Neospora caninum Liverpool]
MSSLRWIFCPSSSVCPLSGFSSDACLSPSFARPARSRCSPGASPHGVSSSRLSSSPAFCRPFCLGRNRLPLYAVLSVSSSRPTLSPSSRSAVSFYSSCSSASASSSFSCLSAFPPALSPFTRISSCPFSSGRPRHVASRQVDGDARTGVGRGVATCLAENASSDQTQERTWESESVPSFSHLTPESSSSASTSQRQKNALFDLSWPAVSSGIPGDAFVEFTTENVQAMTRRDARRENEENPEREELPAGLEAFGRTRGKRIAGEGEDATESFRGERHKKRERGRRTPRIKVFSLSSAPKGKSRRTTPREHVLSPSLPSSPPASLFAPIDDTQLFSLAPASLGFQELLYVLGRASLLLREQEGRKERHMHVPELVDSPCYSPASAASAPPVSPSSSSSPLSSSTRSSFSCDGDLDAGEDILRVRGGDELPLSSSSSVSSSTALQLGSRERACAPDSCEQTAAEDLLGVGTHAESHRCFRRAQLVFWTKLLERLTSLLSSLKPREFTRAVQTLGYARPLLLQLATECQDPHTDSHPAAKTTNTSGVQCHRKTRSDASRSSASSAAPSFPSFSSSLSSPSSLFPSLSRSEAGATPARRKEDAAAKKAEDERVGDAFLAVDRSLVVQLRRQVGLRANAFHGECLSRIFYGMVKGHMENDAQFIDFLTSEVLERLERKLRPWQLQRIFQAAFNSPQVSRHFKSVLCTHLVSRLAFLPGQSLADFLPKCAELGLAKKVENVVKINVISGKRLRAWQDTTLLISLGYPLVMYDLISPGNAVALFRRLRELKVETAYPPLDASLVGAQQVLGEHRRVVRRVNAALVPLKLMEARLRVFRPNVYQTLSPSLKAWLGSIRETPLKLTSFLPPVDQAHVHALLLAGLTEVLESASHSHFDSALFHPHLQGPFLLEAASPATQTYLEWDKPWLFYPSFKQFESRVYTETKRRCLAEEGWALIALSAEQCLSQPTSDRLRWIVAQLRTRLVNEAEETI